MTYVAPLVIGWLFLICASAAFADCPNGGWPRSMYSGPGGGLYTGPGGGASTAPGGGLYTGPGGGLNTGPGGGLYSGPGVYCGNFPPWPVFIDFLAGNGYEEEAELIRSALKEVEKQKTP